MGGGLMQLVAYGTQDIYLTGNPQITFFKVVYRRHTNFAMESIPQNIEGEFNFGRDCSCTIARNGDLVHKMYVEIDFEAGKELPIGINSFQIINEVELEIGGQLIDRHYGEWMNIWCELTHTDNKKSQLNKLIGGGTFTKRYIPLQFSFCRNVGLAIPLIALQYHEVKLHFRLANASALNTGYSIKNPVISSACLYVDYIYLDADERRRFAQNSHEFLIEQVQSIVDNDISPNCLNRYRLNLNHPVKEIVWVHNKETNGNKFDYSEATTQAILRLNGHDRLDRRPGDYFKNVQRYQHHNGSEYYDGSFKNNVPIYLYSFALEPEEHQPSGACNFSRIDEALLEINASNETGVTNIYAVNYNVLKVMSGMGGLAYSN